MISAQREVMAVANAEGIELGEPDLEAWLEVLAKLGPDNYTSMAQDALAGRETEVDVFAGRVCELGRKHGIATPVNELLRQLLKAGTTLGPRTFGQS
jgi:2-dehydropantoate 2-reductase